MTVLITGGAGFIGRRLAAHFPRDHTVRILGHFRSGHRRNLTGLHAELVKASITDRGAVRAAMRGVDYVFHRAAMGSVPESLRRPHECAGANVAAS